MKIGVRYQTFEDVVSIIWCLQDYVLDKRADDTERPHELKRYIIDGIFSFSNDKDIYYFVRKKEDENNEIFKNCDLKVRAFHNFMEDWNTYIGYDKLIQSQNVDPLINITDKEVQQYLDLGNVMLSSASISFQHKNFYFEPFFNINFFYHHYGMIYLNFYKFNNPKTNLIGTYHKLGGKPWRDNMCIKIKNELGDDFNYFQLKDYPKSIKNLYEPYTAFGLWGRNHINSYLDYKTSVCNLVFETLEEYPNKEIETEQYNRDNITEKTLKSLLFCEENIFFVWYGPKKFYEYLTNYGFWFYNSEFYNESVEQSIVNATEELKNLKKRFITNDKVYEYLLEKYGHKLKNNVKLFYSLMDTYYNRDEVLNLIKYGKRN